MTTKFKKRAAGGIIAATLATIIYLFIGQPIGYKGFYDNDTGSYLGISSAEDAQLAWHVKNGDNAIIAYSFDSKIQSSSNWPKISNYIKKARRKGIKTFGIPYSSEKLLASVEAYNKAQPNDSSRINLLVSEIEPYNAKNKDSAYAAFYVTIRTVSNWAQRQTYKVERACYMGWPTAACWDSIVNNTDRTFMHAYLQPAQMTGGGCYGYMKTREITIANIVDLKYASNQSFKYNVVMINSTEPTFSYSYFQSHTWDQPFTDMVSYVSSNGDAMVKKRIQFGGRQIFVSTYGKQARP